jgi:rsbT antagonist protein RsbS
LSYREETMERIPVLKISDFLIVTIQVALDDESALKLQEDILEEIAKTKAKGLLIDITAVDIVDSFMGRMIRDIARMARLMGPPTIVVGMQPAVAITLVELGLKMTGVSCALNLEKGLLMLKEMVEAKEREERTLEAEETEGYEASA